MTGSSRARVDTVVATANVNHHLDRRRAGEALDAVLAHDPDLVALQEWYATRRPLRTYAEPRGLRWWAPVLGGCAIGARAERYTLLSRRQRLLSRPGRADRGERPLGLEPPRLATVATYRDRLLDRTVRVVAYHLVSGVQRDDRYRDDRPALVARHRAEARCLRRVVHDALLEGHDVIALGDSNWHGFALPGLVSAWRPDDHRGTLGPRRQVDDVLTSRPSEDVVLVDTPSDHRAVVVRLPGLVAGGPARA